MIAPAPPITSAANSAASTARRRRAPSGAIDSGPARRPVPARRRTVAQVAEDPTSAAEPARHERQRRDQEPSGSEREQHAARTSPPLRDGAARQGVRGGARQDAEPRDPD